MLKPKKYSDYIGNQQLVTFLRERINNDAFPHATLLVSEEGVGKTSLSKLLAKHLLCTGGLGTDFCNECDYCKMADKHIDTNKSSLNIEVFKMSIEGGKEVAKSVIESVKSGFIKKEERKVIILEECHAMHSDAQNALLTELEYIPENIYIIALTTNELALQKDFKSRFVVYRLSRPTDDELFKLLVREVSANNLSIQGGVEMLRRIIPYADNKPRAALKIIEAMGRGNAITPADLDMFIGVNDATNYEKIAYALNGSLLEGINTIMELQVNDNTQAFLMQVLTAKLKANIIPQDSLLTFMYSIGSHTKLSKENIISAFILAHPNARLMQGLNREEVKRDEGTMIRMNYKEDIELKRTLNPPRMDSMIFGGVKIEERKDNNGS